MSIGEEPWYAAVRGSIRERHLDEGQVLFQQGDLAVSIFAVTEGRVRLVRHAREGALCVLHVATQGDTFAEASMFSPIYHCDAVADVRSRVAIIPKDAMLGAFATDPAIAAAFMARLARQVQTLRSRLEIRNIRAAPERVLQYLLLLSRPGQSVIVFDRPLKDVAAEMGLTHESFYRALSALEARKAIARNGREITLLDGGEKPEA